MLFFGNSSDNDAVAVELLHNLEYVEEFCEIMKDRAKNYDKLLLNGGIDSKIGGITRIDR